MKADVEDIIVPSRSRNAANPELVVTVQKPMGICFIIVSLNPYLALSQEDLTSKALLCDNVLDLTPINGLLPPYDLHAFAEPFFKTNHVAVFLESRTIFKILWNLKHT